MTIYVLLCICKTYGIFIVMREDLCKLFDWGIACAKYPQGHFVFNIIKLMIYVIKYKVIVINFFQYIFSLSSILPSHDKYVKLSLHPGQHNVADSIAKAFSPSLLMCITYRLVYLIHALIWILNLPLLQGTFF